MYPSIPILSWLLANEIYIYGDWIPAGSNNNLNIDIMLVHNLPLNSNPNKFNLSRFKFDKTK